MAGIDKTKFPDYIKDFLTACDDGSFLPIVCPTRFLPDILEMDIRPSDIFVVSWPKSGTTWVQYVITQLVCGEEFLKGKVHLLQKNIHLETVQDRLKIDESEGKYKIAEGLPSPRLLKSHLKISMLPSRLFESKAKVVYIARNPKDAAVSYFNFCLKLSTFPHYKDWADFFQYFCAGLLPFGDWFEHVLPFWEKRNESNVLFMKYEDMKKDPRRAILRLSKFLEKSISEKQLQDIYERSSFDAMKDNPLANPDSRISAFDRTPIPFMRKGTIGDWKNYFTFAQNQRFDKLYRLKMEGCGLKLGFE